MERDSKVFVCLKCQAQFWDIRKGEEHQANCKGARKGFRQPKKSS